jgi:hypothetical protein
MKQCLPFKWNKQVPLQRPFVRRQISQDCSLHFTHWNSLWRASDECELINTREQPQQGSKVRKGKVVSVHVTNTREGTLYILQIQHRALSANCTFYILQIYRALSNCTLYILEINRALSNCTLYILQIHRALSNCTLYILEIHRALSNCTFFTHSAVCQTTGPQPLPKRVLHRVRSSASSFSF